MTFYDMTWLERLLFLKRINGSQGHEETTTSNSFVTDMVAPLRKLLLSFAPKQSGSGDPSPTNVRPISGWDGVSVTVSPTLDTEAGETYSVSFPALGKNLFGGAYNVKYTLDNPIPKGSKITASGSIPESGNTRCNLYNASDARFQNFGMNSTSGDRKYRTNVEVTDEVTAVAFDQAEATDFQLELGSTLTSYEPYTNTVYGGTLDMVSGVLTVTMAMVDMGSLTWSFHGAGGQYSNYFDTNLPSDSIVGNDAVPANIKCEKYATIRSREIATSGYDNNVIALAKNAHRLIACDQSYSDAAVFKASLDGAKLVYELATPQTYQLTPQQINTLIGTNNILTDAEVSEIIYLKKAE